MAIGFNREFVNAVKEGVKTSTIRKHFNGKIGDKIAAYNAGILLSLQLPCLSHQTLCIISV